MGNHPFFTLPFCSKISNIVQNEEKAKKLLNNKIELIIYEDIVNTEIDKQLIDNVKSEMIPIIPNTKNTHQQRVPK